MLDIKKKLEEFIAIIETGKYYNVIYNEYSLQLELTIFLRKAYPDYNVLIEREVKSNTKLSKKRIDIVISSKDKEETEKYLLELKMPNNGKYPEEMYSFIKDICFVEELTNNNLFKKGYCLTIITDSLFYRGRTTKGIYSYFRDGKPLDKKISAPTGEKDEYLTPNGGEEITWIHKKGFSYYLFETK